MATFTPAVAILRNQTCTVCEQPLKRTTPGEHSTALDQIKKCGHVFHRECLAQSLIDGAIGKRAPIMRAECPEAECKEKVWFMFNGPDKLTYNHSPIYPSLPKDQVATLHTVADVEERGPVTRDAQLIKRAAYALTAIAVASFSVAFLSSFTAFSIAAALFTIAAFSESRAIDWYLQVKDNSFQVIPAAEQ